MRSCSRCRRKEKGECLHILTKHVGRLTSKQQFTVIETADTTVSRVLTILSRVDVSLDKGLLYNLVASRRLFHKKIASLRRTSTQ